MWKPIVVGTAVLAVAGSSLVYAQQRFGRPEAAPGFQGTQGAERARPSLDDMRALGEARLAGLKAGLVLNSDQENNWPAFEQASREFAKLRLDRIGAAMAARRNGGAATEPTTDPAQQMRERGTVMADTGAALKKLADAMDPLYKSLDDGQKRRFAVLSRLDRDGGTGFRGRESGSGEERFRDRNGGPGFRGREGDGPRGFGPRRSELDPRDFGRDAGPRRFERDPGGGFEGYSPADRDRNPRRFERREPGPARGERL